LINTTVLKPEVFRHDLLKTGEMCTVEESRQVWKDKSFGRSEWITEKVNVDKPVYAMNFDQLDKYPEDVREQFTKGKFDRLDGYVAGFGRYSWGIKYKELPRDFGKTLTEFYANNKITSDMLINLEYCKDGCMIKEAYVTWDDGK